MPKIDDQPEDPFENLVLDEDFVSSAEHKEASARSRMLASRWKKQPPQDTAWRAPVVPIKRRRKVRWQAPLFVLLAAGLIAVGLNAAKVHDWLYDKAPGTAAAQPSVAPPLTASPTAAPPTPYADQTPDLRHPFVGSPADKWPSGAAGIALPAAKPVGIFSTSTVAKDEQLVKDYLVAAFLDPKTLAGGYPQPALDLVANPSWAHKLVDHPAPGADGIMIVSRFDPKAAVPLDDVRVQGTVSLSGDGDNGLRVRTDFAFVYASHPVGGTEVERTIARRILTFRFYDPYRFQTGPSGTVWIENIDGFTGDQLCGFTQGYLIPYFQTADPSSTAAAGPAPSGSPIDPYDMSKLPDGRSKCSQDSRS
ncbi:hypothetical protein [Streptacidiphilus jiangxiensis]|uniref:Uncharacterized protein n=1 Tax=Streptacidiphilus jiangxiensis TaxID=235985 RepID=A0A1H7Q3Y5_STRJI|nr:hypothetical protein [Streptacidiphilus jiangxiensis]SEL42195.1 hypothetical protein SAMN05414137_108253 [Streptacidiphilus jiangxiensis]